MNKHTEDSSPKISRGNSQEKNHGSLQDNLQEVEHENKKAEAQDELQKDNENNTIGSKLDNQQINAQESPAFPSQNIAHTIQQVISRVTSQDPSINTSQELESIEQKLKRDKEPKFHESECNDYNLTPFHDNEINANQVILDGAVLNVEPHEKNLELPLAGGMNHGTLSNTPRAHQPLAPSNHKLKRKSFNVANHSPKSDLSINTQSLKRSSQSNINSVFANGIAPLRGQPMISLDSIQSSQIGIPIISPNGTVHEDFEFNEEPFYEQIIPNVIPSKSPKHFRKSQYSTSTFPIHDYPQSPKIYDTMPSPIHEDASQTPKNNKQILRTSPSYDKRLTSESIDEMPTHTTIETFKDIPPEDSTLLSFQKLYADTSITTPVSSKDSIQKRDLSYTQTTNPLNAKPQKSTKSPKVSQKNLAPLHSFDIESASNPYTSHQPKRSFFITRRHIRRSFLYCTCGLTTLHLSDFKPKHIFSSFMGKLRAVLNPPHMHPRNYGFQPPYDILQAIAWLLFSSFSISFVVLTLPPLHHWAALPIGVIFTTLCFIWFATNFILGISNSRDHRSRVKKSSQDRHLPENQGLNWCKYCSSFVHPSSKHCRLCDKCVETFDHHCRWLNTCIGKKNYIYFLIFVTDTLAILVFHVVVAVYYVLSFIIEFIAFGTRMSSIYGALPHVLVFVLQLIVTFLVCLAIIPVYRLWIFHLKLITRRQTTYEYIIERRQLKIGFEEAISAGIISAGPSKWKRRILTVFCFFYIKGWDWYRWNKFLKYKKKRDKHKQRNEEAAKYKYSATQNKAEQPGRERSDRIKNELTTYPSTSSLHMNTPINDEQNFTRDIGKHSHADYQNGNHSDSDSSTMVTYLEGQDYPSTSRVASHESLGSLHSQISEPSLFRASSARQLKSMNRVQPLDSQSSPFSEKIDSLELQQKYLDIENNLDTKDHNSSHSARSLQEKIKDLEIRTSKDLRGSQNLHPRSNEKALHPPASPMCESPNSIVGRKRSASHYTPLSRRSVNNPTSSITFLDTNHIPHLLVPHQSFHLNQDSSLYNTSSLSQVSSTLLSAYQANSPNSSRTSPKQPKRTSIVSHNSVQITKTIPNVSPNVGNSKSFDGDEQRMSSSFTSRVNIDSQNSVRKSTDSQARRRSSAFSSLCIADEYDFERDVYDLWQSPTIMESTSEEIFNVQENNIDTPNASQKQNDEKQTEDLPVNSY